MAKKVGNNNKTKPKQVGKSTTKKPPATKTSKSLAKTARPTPIKTKSKKQMTRSIWWMIMFGGILAIAFGVFAMFWPELTLEIATFLFAAFVAIMGLVWLYQAFAHLGKDKLWWLGAAFGVVAVCIGIYLFINQSAVIGLFSLLFVLYVFAQALLDFVVASYSGKNDKWIWVIAGILGLIFGLMMIMNPMGTSEALIWILGVYLLIHGMVSVAHALMVKRLLS